MHRNRVPVDLGLNLRNSKHQETGTPQAHRQILSRALPFFFARSAILRETPEFSEHVQKYRIKRLEHPKRTDKSYRRPWPFFFARSATLRETLFFAFLNTFCDQCRIMST